MSVLTMKCDRCGKPAGVFALGKDRTSLCLMCKDREEGRYVRRPEPQVVYPRRQAMR